MSESRMIRALRNICDLYVEGFRNMDVGKTLWGVILIKLFIMFAVLRLLFFPDFLGRLDSEQKADYVLRELTVKP